MSIEIDGKRYVGVNDTYPDMGFPPLTIQYSVSAATAGREVYWFEWHPRRKRYRKSVHRAYRKLGVFP